MKSIAIFLLIFSSLNTFAGEKDRKPAQASAGSVSLNVMTYGFRYQEDNPAFVIFGKESDGKAFELSFEYNPIETAIFTACWTLINTTRNLPIVVKRSAEKPYVRGCSLL